MNVIPVPLGSIVSRECNSKVQPACVPCTNGVPSSYVYVPSLGVCNGEGNTDVCVACTGRSVSDWAVAYVRCVSDGRVPARDDVRLRGVSCGQCGMPGYFRIECVVAGQRCHVWWTGEWVCGSSECTVFAGLLWGLGCMCAVHRPLCADRAAWRSRSCG